MSEVVIPLAHGTGGEELGWQERALCAQTDPVWVCVDSARGVEVLAGVPVTDCTAEPEDFFPEKGGSTREAKKVCRACEVRTECLEYALQHDERFGIWGGLSERERRKLKRQAV